MRRAIATFERSLVTPGSPFDAYLCGDDSALTPEQKSRWERFQSFGCVSCHQGMNAGGNMFQRFGVMVDPATDPNDGQADDLGRFHLSGREKDRNVFRVPSLRNVARTGPYFHDGKVATLAQAVRLMGQYQLGLELSDRDVRLLVAFLETLTGRPPEIAR